jgi:hypothetical protein
VWGGVWLITWCVFRLLGRRFRQQSADFVIGA